MPNGQGSRWTDTELADRSLYISEQLKNNKRLSPEQKTELRREQRAIRQELDKRYEATQAAWNKAYQEKMEKIKTVAL